MTGDLFHSMDIAHLLRVDENHQVIVFPVKQEMLYMIFGLGSTLLVLNLRCSSKFVHTEEEVAHMSYS